MTHFTVKDLDKLVEDRLNKPGAAPTTMLDRLRQAMKRKQTLPQVPRLPKI